MAAEANLTTVFAKALDIDFVNQFGKSITTLLNLIGVQRLIPMNSGSVIKTYKSSVTLAGGSVAKGDIIPLSEVKREVADTFELAWNKHRKAVPMEDIQTYGYEQACIQSDATFLREIQGTIRSDFLAQLASGTTAITAKTLQEAFSKGWATVQTKFEDDGAQTVAFVNPNDVADHLGSANITTQTAFGLTFVKGFTGIDVLIVAPAIPVKTVYATAAENLVLAFANMAGGEIDKVFDFEVEETGLIGVTHDLNKQRLQAETITAYGLKLFAERLDGIAKITINAAA
jgi:hypothetical protein